MVERADFPVVRIATAGEQVADALRDLIVVRAWAEGQRLPVETDLAAQLGVSRGTLRKALRHLCDEGLIVARSGAAAGTYIGRRSSSPRTPTLARIMRARRWIEIPAAGSAVLRADPARLDEIELRRQRARTGTARFDAHREFHDVLLSAGSEPLWRDVAEPLFAWLGTNIDRESVPADVWTAVDHDHRRIIEAVRSRSAASACEAMADHLDCMGEHYASMRVG